MIQVLFHIRTLYANIDVRSAKQRAAAQVGKVFIPESLPLGQDADPTLVMGINSPSMGIPAPVAEMVQREEEEKQSGEPGKSPAKVRFFKTALFGCKGWGRNGNVGAISDIKLTK